MGIPRTMRAVVAAVAPLLTAAAALVAQTYPTGNDPRNGLKPGMLDAGMAASGMRLVSFSPKPAVFDYRARPDVHQLRPRLPRQLRLPGQLLRLHDLGREQSGEAGAVVGRSVRHVAGRSVDLSATCSSSPPRAAATATIARRAACRTRHDHMAGRPHLRRLRSRDAEAGEERADVQRLAHAHDHPEPEGQGRHLHLCLGQPGRAAGDGAGRAARTERIRPTRRTRCSGST